jgi:hypothetical protein
MTTTQKLQATLPDGNIATRKTGREYKYVVAARISVEYNKYEAQQDLRHCNYMIKNGDLDATELAQRTQQKEALMAQLNNDDFTVSEFFVLQWCLRRDLAEKAAAKYAKIVDTGATLYTDITIIEVTAS